MFIILLEEQRQTLHMLMQTEVATMASGTMTSALTTVMMIMLQLMTVG
jgi:hypothetical protein